MDFELHKWQKEFAGDVANYADNSKIAQNLRNVFPYPYTLADAEWYVNDCIEKEGKYQICRAIVVNGEAVGSIGIFVQTDVHTKCAELGYWLGEPFWNSGIMTRAVKQLCTEAFSEFDILRIYAEPFAHNSGSCRVLEKAGFRLEGRLKSNIYKNGKIYDSCIYGLLK